jgi:hypothetical protein
VGKPRRLPRLLDEATREIFILRQVRMHNFDCHWPLKALIHGLIDGRHATSGNATFNDVAVVDYPAE